jgi:hypothetical protein
MVKSARIARGGEREKIMKFSDLFSGWTMRSGMSGSPRSRS